VRVYSSLLRIDCLTINITSADAPAVLERIERLMSEVNQDQVKLDADVSGMADAFATVVAELKAQAAAHGAPLDFTNADNLLRSMQTEATSDAPPAPPAPAPDPAPVDQPPAPSA
jgi:hypothetical protein